VEVTWRWDGARKMYAGKERHIPLPKKGK
jgi:hypothetical protein